MLCIVYIHIDTVRQLLCIREKIPSIFERDTLVLQALANLNGHLPSHFGFIRFVTGMSLQLPFRSSCALGRSSHSLRDRCSARFYRGGFGQIQFQHGLFQGRMLQAFSINGPLTAERTLEHKCSNWQVGTRHGLVKKVEVINLCSGWNILQASGRNELSTELLGDSLHHVLWNSPKELLEGRRCLHRCSTGLEQLHGHPGFLILSAQQMVQSYP